MADRKRYYGDLKLIAGNSNHKLAELIAAELGQPLENAKVERFDDGEIKIDLNCVVRGHDIFIIEPICQSSHSTIKRPCLMKGGADRICSYQSINDNLMELLTMIDGARRASADRITAVVPYMAYSKQEKKKIGHEPITAKLVANLITTAGADRLLTVDLHTPAIEGFFDIPVDHMRMAPLMAAHFRHRPDLKEAVVVSPDAGGVARATEFRDHLKAGLQQVIDRDEMAIAFKRRTPEGEPTVIDMVGDVQGRPAIIFDDMIQSGGTLLQVVDILFARGATEVCVAAVHADFIPGVVSRLRSSRIKTLLISDTTSAGQGLRGNKIQVVSAARILAHAMWRIHTEQTVGWIFDTLKKGEELPPVVRHGD